MTFSKKAEGPVVQELCANLCIFLGEGDRRPFRSGRRFQALTTWSGLEGLFFLFFCIKTQNPAVKQQCASQFLQNALWHHQDTLLVSSCSLFHCAAGQHRAESYIDNFSFSSFWLFSVACFAKVKEKCVQCGCPSISNKRHQNQNAQVLWSQLLLGS